MNRLPAILSILTVAIAIATPTAHAQRGDLSAREALNALSVQFGPRSVQWVAEMRARGGVPQPAEWDIVSYDSRAPRLLYRFAAGRNGVADRGIDEQRYPQDIPSGYFSANQLAVDSVAAFTVAEGEARKAKMAFDSCDYLVRVRDFSNEPIWRLELLDASRNLVGKIYISANSGQVYRTVWIYRDERARPDGLPLIIDSYAPDARQPLTTSIAPQAPSVGRQAPYTSQREIPTDTGIAVMPPRTREIPTETGIAGMPPRSQRPNQRLEPSSPQPYRPVSPSGSVTDDDIPEPPAITSAPPTSQMPDLRATDPPAASRPDPSRPPIDVPAGSSTNGGRIPPPPIP